MSKTITHNNKVELECKLCSLGDYDASMELHQLHQTHNSDGDAEWELGVYGTNTFLPLKSAMHLNLPLKNKVFIKTMTSTSVGAYHTHQKFDPKKGVQKGFHFRNAVTIKRDYENGSYDKVLPGK